MREAKRAGHAERKHGRIEQRPARPSPSPRARFHEEAPTTHELAARTEARAPSWHFTQGPDPLRSRAPETSRSGLLKAPSAPPRRAPGLQEGGPHGHTSCPANDEEQGVRPHGQRHEEPSPLTGPRSSRLLAPPGQVRPACVAPVTRAAQRLRLSTALPRSPRARFPGCSFAPFGRSPDKTRGLIGSRALWPAGTRR